MDNNSTASPQPVRPRSYLAVLLLLAALAALLLADLSGRGPAWHFFWSQTGKEEPLSQIRGMIELAGNLIRQPLHTAPLAPINHRTEVPYGINTFLQKEVEVEKLHEQLRLIAEAGFVWLRQEFPWEDLEVDGPGLFTDSRNDMTGDGLPDTIDAWLKYDRIVDLVEEYGLRLMVRLSNPPAWSRAENPPTAGGSLAPPDDFQDFVNYAVAVAERYRGRITHYQVWNEPNIYPEWGEQFVDPAAYTELLCRTYAALKAVDPEIVVLSGALAPTISLDGYQGYSDLVFLQNMYDHGAGDCFDIMSVQGYGLFSGPTDRRMRSTTVNFARNLYIRDLMVANGDAHKPIWVSEAAWNAVPDDPNIADLMRFGQVTEEQAARWMPLAYQRAWEEWPWVNVIFYWFFTRADDSERGQSFFYFRMAEPDYSPERPTFTLLPVYHSMRDYIHGMQPVLYPGVHQAESWAISRSDDAYLWPMEPNMGAQFDAALYTDRLSFTFHGTDLLLRWAGWSGEALAISGDCGQMQVASALLAPLSRLLAPGDWQRLHLRCSGGAAGTYTVHLQSQGPFIADVITVVDRSGFNLAPAGAAGGALALFALWLLADALRRRRS